MLLLVILVQFVLYGVFGYLFYRLVYKPMLANRAASMTTRPADDDYMPEIVDAAFIGRVSTGATRNLPTARAQGLARILEQWNPAAFTPVTPGAYDASVQPVFDLFVGEGDGQIQAAQLTTLLTATYGVSPQDVPGMVNYLTNWLRLNP